GPRSAARGVAAVTPAVAAPAALYAVCSAALGLGMATAGPAPRWPPTAAPAAPPATAPSMSAPATMPRWLARGARGAGADEDAECALGSESNTAESPACQPGERSARGLAADIHAAPK